MRVKTAPKHALGVRNRAIHKPANKHRSANTLPPDLLIETAEHIVPMLDDRSFAALRATNTAMRDAADVRERMLGHCVAGTKSLKYFNRNLCTTLNMRSIAQFAFFRALSMRLHQLPAADQGSAFLTLEYAYHKLPAKPTEKRADALAALIDSMFDDSYALSRYAGRSALTLQRLQNELMRLPKEVQSLPLGSSIYASRLLPSMFQSEPLLRCMLFYGELAPEHRGLPLARFISGMRLDTARSLSVHFSWATEQADTLPGSRLCEPVDGLIELLPRLPFDALPVELPRMRGLVARMPNSRQGPRLLGMLQQLPSLPADVQAGHGSAIDRAVERLLQVHPSSAALECRLMRLERTPHGLRAERYLEVQAAARGLPADEKRRLFECLPEHAAVLPLSQRQAVLNDVLGDVATLPSDHRTEALRNVVFHSDELDENHMHMCRAAASDITPSDRFAVLGTLLKHATQRFGTERFSATYFGLLDDAFAQCGGRFGTAERDAGAHFLENCGESIMFLPLHEQCDALLQIVAKMQAHDLVGEPNVYQAIAEQLTALTTQERNAVLHKIKQTFAMCDDDERALALDATIQACTGHSDEMIVLDEWQQSSLHAIISKLPGEIQAPPLGALFSYRTRHATGQVLLRAYTAFHTKTMADLGVHYPLAVLPAVRRIWYMPPEHVPMVLAQLTNALKMLSPYERESWCDELCYAIGAVPPVDRLAAFLCLHDVVSELPAELRIMPLEELAKQLSGLPEQGLECFKRLVCSKDGLQIPDRVRMNAALRPAVESLPEQLRSAATALLNEL